MGNFTAETAILTAQLNTLDGLPLLYSRISGTFSNNYATGGDSFDVSTWYTPGSVIDAAVVRENADLTTGYTYKVNIQALPNDTTLLILAINPSASHTHVLRFQTNVAANAVTAQANQLRTGAVAFDVAGVANNAGEGGIVNAAAGAGTEVANATNLATLDIVVEVWGRRG